jgi:AcrR family transcriptional regulator
MVMSKPEPSPKWRRRKDARPAEIIAAAYEVFAEKGFAAARLDDIATAAGVSKGALYLYFETKQDIFEAVVREAVGPNIDVIETMAAAHPGPLADLLRMVIPRIAVVAAESPLGKVVKLVIGESGNFPELARIWHDTLIDRALGMLAGIIAQAQARGEARPGDPRAYAASLISPMLMAILFRETFAPVGGKPFDIPALMTQHVELFVAGIQPDGRPATSSPKNTSAKSKTK